MDNPHPPVGSSREEGAGSRNLPDPSGRSTQLRSFARALSEFAETLLYVGAMSHYEDAVTERLMCELFEELNNRTAEVVRATGEWDPTWLDVDVVFDEVEAVAHKALHGSHKA